MHLLDPLSGASPFAQTPKRSVDKKIFEDRTKNLNESASENIRNKKKEKKGYIFF